LEKLLYISAPSAEKLLAKIGKIDGLACWQGHSVFLQKRRPCGSKARGKIMQPLVFPVLQGNGPVRQRSLSADLMFGYFASKVK